jgi:S-formylglutathione hydrolase FrmB
VVVLMAGMPGGPADWLNGGGLQNTLDTFAKTHHGITPYVFVVDENSTAFNDTECVDSPRGNAETYLTVDVPNYITSHFNVAATPNHWAIGGLSLGGTCGIMLALRHPDLYSYFLDFGGESAPEIGSVDATTKGLFAGSAQLYAAHTPSHLLQTQHYKNVGGYFAVGKGDDQNLINNMEALYKQTQSAGLNTAMEQVGGEHTFGVWQQAFHDALPWISNQLGATVCGASCS